MPPEALPDSSHPALGMMKERSGDSNAYRMGVTGFTGNPAIMEGHPPVYLQSLRWARK